MSGIGDAIDAWFAITTTALLIFVPLGLWKLIEIVIWIIRHVKVGIE
jgi:hypothetical protein